jgi:hypothetical protein
MCRSIQTLRGADPAATDEEVRDAALQYVRKISGSRAPSQAKAEVFETAVAEIAAATRRLLDGLVVSPRTKPPVPVQRRLAADRDVSRR